MMVLQLDTYDGTSCTLPTLLRWDLEYTGAVPCDSLSATCLYDKGMADILPKAVQIGRAHV